jgi:1,3-beta-glucan synthase
VGIHRAVNKILIASALTREYKHDQTNQAWWTGKWGALGSAAVGQAPREFMVKLIELNLWSSDFLLGHVLLIILTVPLLIPGVDRVHSMMLCELLVARVERCANYPPSLAPPFEANTASSLLDEAEEATACYR